MSNPLVDAYDKLFLKNENIAAPTTFLDSSTANPKTMTAAGGAKQLPIKLNKSAAFFNGTADYIVVPDHSDFDFTGAFTIEMFVNFSSVSAYSGLFAAATSGNDAFFHHLDNRIEWNLNGNNNRWSWDPSPNTWYHIMFRRDGSNNLTISVDGSALTLSVGSGSVSGTVAHVGDLYIGRDGSQYMTGWMKEFRMSDVARTVAVPTAKYTSDANTKLLLHFDTPALSPIGPALYFDGSGDYLTLADHADWDIGTGDFTVEFWIRSDGTIVNGCYPFSHGNTPMLGLKYVSGEFTPYLNGAAVANYAYTVIPHTWIHYAMSRSGTSFKAFINGKEVASATNSANITGASTVFSIGAFNDGTNAFKGWIREFRLSNSARYTADFTPSQNGFIADANTKLYIKGNEANGVTTFLDSETSPKTVTTVGGAKIKYVEDYRTCVFVDDGNTGHKPYPIERAKVDFFALSSGVMLLPLGSSSDKVSTPTGADFEFGTGDWTFEFFARMSYDPSGQAPLLFQTSGTYSQGVAVAVYGEYIVYVDGTSYFTSGYVPVGGSGDAKTENIWHHVMGVRTGNTFKFFINGTQQGSDYDVTGVDISGLSGDLQIFADAYKASFIENFRIAKGIARKTATFDPPFDEAAVAGNFFLIF